MSNNFSNDDLQKAFGESYNAESLGGDTGLKGVRLSPSQYLGSASIEGANQATIELIQNGVDEASAMRHFYLSAGVKEEDIPKFHITVKIDLDDTTTVADTGRGVPVDISEKFNRPVVEAAFEEINVGGKGKGYVEDGKSAYVGRTIGKHGSGAACANATSDFFHVDTYVMKNGQHYRVEWEKAEKKLATKHVGESPNNFHGTVIKFRPSKEVFDLYSGKEDKELERFYDETTFHNILTEYAYNTDGIIFKLQFQQKDGTYSETVYDSYEMKPNERIKSSNVKSDVYSFETVNFDLDFEYKLHLVVSFDRNHFITCNYLRLREGNHFVALGEALETVYDEVTNRVNEMAKEKGLNINLTTQELSRKNLGSLINFISSYSIIKMSAPEYGGQTKEELRTPRIKEPIRKAIVQAFENELSGFKKALVETASLIYFNSVEREHLAKIQKEQEKKKEELKKLQKEIIGKGNSKSIRGMSDEEKNITHARNPDTRKVVLYAVEGFTAKAAMEKARNVNNDTIFALSQRPTNVYNYSKKAFLTKKKSRELFKVFNGNNNGDYLAVVLATDPDADGDYIKLYLLAFIWEFFPHYLTQGRVFIFDSPKYSGIYEDDYVFFTEFEEMAKHRSENPHYSYSSYKGLGSIPSAVLKKLLEDKTAFIQIDPKTIEQGMPLLKKYLSDTKFKQKFILNKFASPSLLYYMNNQREILKYQEIDFKFNELDTQFTKELSLSDVRRQLAVEKAKDFLEIELNEEESFVGSIDNDLEIDLEVELDLDSD